MKRIKRFFRKTIVVDSNLLPQEYKNNQGKVSLEDIEKYENTFNVNIVLLDSSAKNTRGGNTFYIKKI